MKLKPKNLWLAALLLVSLLVRVYKIDLLPLFGDEVDVGNLAYSLLKTGRDLKANLLPTYLSSFAESRAPLLIYATVPSIAIFGHTPLAVRLPAIIFGLLSLLFFYKLVHQSTKNHKLALISTAIMAFSPWHFHYSRSAFEVTLLLSLLLSATYFFKKNRLLSLILFALSFYTYNTSNIFTPLLLIFLFLKSNTKPQPKNILLFALLLLPLAINILTGQAGSRFNLISIFKNPQAIEKIIFKRTGFSSTGKASERIFHNKANSWLNQFTRNYLTALSPDFLFLDGDPNPRHSLPDFGLLPYVLILPLLIGLFKYKPKQSLFLFWLLIAPIAASLTQAGGSHATRLFLLLPPLSFFIAQGLLKLNKYLLLVVLVLLAHFYLNFGHEYLIHYPKESFENWHYGYQSLLTSLPKTQNRLFVSNRLYSSLPHFSFYQQINPALLQTISDQQVQLPFDISGFKLDQSTFFVNDWQDPDPLNKIQSLAQPGDIFVLFQLKDIPGDWNLSADPLSGFSTIRTINNPNQTIFGQIIQKI